MRRRQFITLLGGAAGGRPGPPSSDLIAAISGTPSGLAAKSATTTIPIVFAMGSDPSLQDWSPASIDPGRSVQRFRTGLVDSNPKRTNDVLQKPDNSKSYRQTLGITVPPTLLIRADEVIE